jgi:hypothetical protein
MVARIILGDRGGVLDAWVSKPGIDVNSAGIGQLLLGNNRGVHQVMAGGRTKLAGPPTISGPTDYTITLPGIFAGLNNLWVWGELYRIDTNTGTINFGAQYQAGNYNDGAFKVTSGNLIVSSFLTSTIGSGPNPVELWANWMIFRELY